MMKWMLFLLSCLAPVCLWGQEKLSAVEKDSIRYTRLKEQFYKRKITKGIYQLFFNDVYNRKKSSAEVVEIEKNIFDPYEGWTVRNITIQQLNMLGESVYDTNRTSNKFQEFVSNKLHRNTREKVIRNSLLFFDEGDLVDPVLFKDNERLLRQGNVFVDARIIPIPIPGDLNRVDILVLLQDVWPIIPEGSFGGLSNFRAGVTNYNVRGWAHTNTVSVRWRQADTLQQLGMRILYRVPYIGRTFISGEMGVIWERDLKHQFVRLSRPFLSIETVNAGGIEVGVREVREYKKEMDNVENTFTYTSRYGYYDFWYGRAFRISPARPNQRLVAAARFYRYKFLKRPEVTPDSNRTYWNQSALLFSFGYSNRNYLRDLLIYGFGRTEDVPIGSMMTFTLGRDATEFGHRGYAGLRFSKGGYLPGHSGYLYGLVDLGSYLQLKEAHQGLLSTTVNYFTPLIRVGLSQVRQFVNFRYTHGIRRDALEYINLTDEYGIRGVFSDQLVGKKRLNAGIETVLFTPGSFLGFRGAHFIFADFGLIAQDNKIWTSKLYQAYGAGVRLRNEHLTFKTIEFRIAYYPNIPTLTRDWRFRLQGVTTLKLQDFEMSAPEIIPFQ